MFGKVSLGQLYLTDMKGADKVFSIENRNSAYAADRRKVVKKSDSTDSYVSSDESSPGSESRIRVRRSKSLDMTDSDIVGSKPEGKSNVRAGKPKLSSRPAPSRSESAELVPSPPPPSTSRVSPNVKELCKAFATTSETNHTKSLRSSGSTVRTCSLSSASSNDTDF